MEEQSAGKKSFLKQLNKQLKKGFKSKETLEVEPTKEFHFDVKYYYVYRMFLLVILILFVALFITNALFYKMIFNEERSQNFQSSDIGHAKKTKYIMLLVLLYFLTVIILFFIIAVIVKVYCKQVYENNYQEHFKRILFADKKILISFFGLFGLVFTVLIIFMLANKSFTHDMKFPSGNSEEDELDNEESPTEQPKFLLTYFTVFILALFGLYLVLREAKDIDDYAVLGLHLFLIALILIIATLLIGFYGQKKIKGWIPVLSITIVLLIIFSFIEKHIRKL